MSAFSAPPARTSPETSRAGFRSIARWPITSSPRARGRA
jgi:hypothetical protein